MYFKEIKKIVTLFNANGLKIKGGMNKRQIIKAQDFYGITFPPDLKELLMAVTPIHKSFYNWNDYSPQNVETIKRLLLWPVEGALFDVEHNDFWLKSWGEKPTDLDEKLLRAKKHMEKVPKLIPVFCHRYISSIPNEAQNPVYSVYQMDVIFYGKDLWDYFDVEFGRKKQQEIEFDKIKPIPFWHDIVTNMRNIADSYFGMDFSEK